MPYVIYYCLHYLDDTRDSCKPGKVILHEALTGLDIDFGLCYVIDGKYMDDRCW